MSNRSRPVQHKRSRVTIASRGGVKVTTFKNGRTRTTMQRKSALHLDERTKQVPRESTTEVMDVSEGFQADNERVPEEPEVIDTSRRPRRTRVRVHFKPEVC